MTKERDGAIEAVTRAEAVAKASGNPDTSGWVARYEASTKELTDLKKTFDRFKILVKSELNQAKNDLITVIGQNEDLKAIVSAQEQTIQSYKGKDTTPGADITKQYEGTNWIDLNAPENLSLIHISEPTRPC